jgi:hypothetical protein
MNYPIHSISTIPVYHWHGAPPFPLALSAAETGSATLLILLREGETCLLPLTWDRNLPPSWSRPTHATHSFYADALDREAFQLTLNNLQQDGWQVSGRLHVQFVGEYAADNFWPTIEKMFWQTTG